MEHLILAEEPKCSGFVNLSKQLLSEIGPLWSDSTVGRSREMSQNGSIVVETFLQDFGGNFPLVNPMKFR